MNMPRKNSWAKVISCAAFLISLLFLALAIFPGLLSCLKAACLGIRDFAANVIASHEKCGLCKHLMSLLSCLKVACLDIFDSAVNIFNSDCEKKISDAICGVMSVLGLINFTYPYIVTVRNTRMYGISLSQVMYWHFRWHSWAYVVYAVLIVLGIWFGKLENVFKAALCLVGVVFAYISTVIVASQFVFRQQKAKKYIELYLIYAMETSKNKRKNIKLKKAEDEYILQIDEHILQIGEYIHENYAASQNVPHAVVSGLLDILDPSSTDLCKSFSNYEKREISESLDKRADDGETHFFIHTRSKGDDPSDGLVRNVHLIQAACGNIFNGFDVPTQATLLEKLLLALAKTSEAKNTTEKADTAKGENIIPVNLMLCGIAAYLRTTIGNRKNPDDWFHSWQELLDRILTAYAISTAVVSSSHSKCFQSLLKSLIMLIEASALVDITSLHINITKEKALLGKYKNLIDLFSRINDRLGCDGNAVISYYSLGQVIVLASSDPDYDPERSYMRSFIMLEWLDIFRKQAKQK